MIPQSVKDSTNQKKIESPQKNSKFGDKKSDIKGSVIIKHTSEVVKSKVDASIERSKIGDCKTPGGGSLKTLASLKRYEDRKVADPPKIQPVQGEPAKKVSETSKLRSVRRKPGLIQCQASAGKTVSYETAIFITPVLVQVILTWSTKLRTDIYLLGLWLACARPLLADTFNPFWSI